uniref:Zinc finger protein 630 n=1 Tax=Aotus nancymaae TaxID=37293 RepID=A0A2K5EZS2_AOTNA
MVAGERKRQQLNPAQKTLHRDVMLETYSHLVSVGCSGIKPEVIFKVEHGKDPWIKDSELSRWIYPDREKGLKSSQRIISGELLFQMEILERAPEDNSLYSVLKIWHIDNQIDRHQGNQDRVLRPVTVIGHETLTEETDSKYSAFGKMFNRCTDLAPSSKKFNKFESCENSFKSSSDLLNYSRSYARKDPIDRFGCGRPPNYNASCSVPEKEAHIQYKKVQAREKPNVCSMCGKGFIKKSQFIIHQRIHTGEKPYVCGDCRKAFSEKSNLTVHQRIHTREKSCESTECGRAFSRKSPFIVHQRVHTGEKPSECFECPKSHLIIHKRVHIREKPFECGECRKAFCETSHLFIHRITHTGEKPYECTECGKTFPRQTQFIIHQRTHTGEKPYECSECGKAFCEKSPLIIHQKTHPREKSPECTEFGMTFYPEITDDYTSEKTRWEKPSRCSDCGKAFCQHVYFTGHQNPYRKHTLYVC